MKKIRGIFIFSCLMIKLIFFFPTPTPEKTVLNYVRNYSNTQQVIELKEECRKKGMELSVRSRGTTVVWEYRTIKTIWGGPNEYEKVKSQFKAYINETEAQQQVLLTDVKADCPFVTSMNQEFYDNKGFLMASGEVK